MSVNENIGLVVACVSGLVWAWSVREVKRGNTFKTTPWLLPIGVFVWGDGVVMGLFWILWAVLVALLNNLYASILLWSLFWIVRSLGEVIYWLNQQFSTIKRNNPKDLMGGKIFGEGIWFIYQIIWQCVLVVMLFVSVWAFKNWM